MAQQIAAGVVTVSDGVAQGVRDDASGRAVKALLTQQGFDVSRHEVVPDERQRIERALTGLAEQGISLIVTTGGTGFGPRDVTPEATKAVIDRDAPGLAEEMRAAGRDSTPFAALSRGVAGSRGSTLIVNLPGSEKGAIKSLTAILPALPHAVELLSGHTVHGPSDEGQSKGEGHDHGAAAPSATALDERLAERRAAGEPSVVGTAVKVIGNPPCRVGQKILLGPSGALAGTLGCAEFDQSAVQDAPLVLAGGGPVTHTYTHELGAVEVYLEPIVRRPLLVVFSATPVAFNLMRWGRDVGFEPVLVEPRTERVTLEHRSAGQVRSDLHGLDLNAEAMAVHTDHDAPAVADSVAALLRSPAGFIGVMGSQRHVGPHVERLKEMGFSGEDLGRIRTPVGIDIGARTAEEIALSILAGLVASRRGATGGWLDRR